jgi:hypothetical protein
MAKWIPVKCLPLNLSYGSRDESSLLKGRQRIDCFRYRQRVSPILMVGRSGSSQRY